MSTVERQIFELGRALGAARVFVRCLQEKLELSDIPSDLLEEGRAELERRLMEVADGAVVLSCVADRPQAGQDIFDRHFYFILKELHFVDLEDRDALKETLRKAERELSLSEGLVDKMLKED